MEKISTFTIDGGINCVKAEGIPRLNIYKTFDCGQCFRFDPVSEFGNKYEFGGVAFGRYVIFAQNSDDEIIIYNSTKEDYLNIWRSFLSLDVDYDKINLEIKSAIKSDHMARACAYADGIRILRQDGWEAICSFIISQNNNIPRIKKIISQMCQKYGQSVDFLGKSYYTFPSPQVLFDAGADQILLLKTGFRAKYIYDATKSILEGSVDLEKIKAEDNFNNCLEVLCTIKGIGPKVACCALLFGFGKTEAFPIDVWIKRVIENHFPEGINIDALGKNAGIAQQYLFYYERYNSK
ncbi:MAG: DNA-3-methyladenine glycosylase 2 family protein [Clostridia bacterium]|nr:DNA-3-methyladenine glycosylase 2 family protein [Clostridia bacterium]